MLRCYTVVVYLHMACCEWHPWCGVPECAYDPSARGGPRLVRGSAARRAGVVWRGVTGRARFIVIGIVGGVFVVRIDADWMWLDQAK